MASSSSLSSWNLSICLAREGRSTAFIASCDDPNALQPLIKCAVSTEAGVEVALSNASFWSHESSIDVESRVPRFSVYRHARRIQYGDASGVAHSAGDGDGDDDDAKALYIIHTARGSASQSSASCPQSLIIPCLALESTTEQRQPAMVPTAEPSAAQDLAQGVRRDFSHNHDLLRLLVVTVKDHLQRSHRVSNDCGDT